MVNMTNISQQTRNKGEAPSVCYRACTENLEPTLDLMGTDCFSPKIGNKARMSFLTTLIQHSIETLAQLARQEKKT